MEDTPVVPVVGPVGVVGALTVCGVLIVTLSAAEVEEVTPALHIAVAATE